MDHLGFFNNKNETKNAEFQVDFSEYVSMIYQTDCKDNPKIKKGVYMDCSKENVNYNALIDAVKFVIEQYDLDDSYPNKFDFTSDLTEHIEQLRLDISSIPEEEMVDNSKLPELKSILEFIKPITHEKYWTIVRVKIKLVYTFIKQRINI